MVLEPVPSFLFCSSLCIVRCCGHRRSRLGMLGLFGTLWNRNGPIEHRITGVAPLIDRTIVRDVFFVYRYHDGGVVQRLVHAMKYHGYPSVGLRLGERVGDALKESLLRVQLDLLVPMPIHGSRYRERRFNQSERIAHGIAMRTGIALDVHAARRIMRTLPQAGLNAVQRAGNIKNAFATDKRRSVKGKRIGLVDDVITTGATVTNARARSTSPARLRLWRSQLPPHNGKTKSPCITRCIQIVVKSKPIKT